MQVFSCKFYIFFDKMLPFSFDCAVHMKRGGCYLFSFICTSCSDHSITSVTLTRFIVPQ